MIGKKILEVVDDRLLHLLGLALLVSLLSACGLNMETNYRKMRPALINHQYDEANEYLDGVKGSFYSKKNRLLFYMDKGAVLSFGGRYKESNRYLEKAKVAAAELWTESVTTNAAAWLTTDNTLPYQGEDFEKVLLHFFAALNHIALGDYSAARVEARQITNKLELYNSKYEEAPSLYKDDAFARWLAGKLAETEGGYSALNDAWIDYRKSLTVYREDYGKRYGTRLPQLLVEDALRVSHGLGADFAEEHAALKTDFPEVSFVLQENRAQLGEVILFHLNGEAPFKIDRFWTVRAGREVLRIAYPQFVLKKHKITKMRVRVLDAVQDSEIFEDVSSIAVRNLKDRMARIKKKAITRQVTKFLAAKGVQATGRAVSKGGGKAGGAGAALQVAGALWSAGSAIAEESDKRSWITLPAQIGVSRLFLEPGKHKLEIEFLSNSGAVIERSLRDVEVLAGKSTFRVLRTYR